MNSRLKKFVPLVMVFVLLLVYLAFPTKNYYWDGIEFAQIIERAGAFNASLLHPNHLIYNALGYVCYRFLSLFDAGARAITALQIVGSLFSALGALVLFQILKASFRSTYLAAALTFLFSFSALWWKFSTDANSYVPSIFFIILSFYLILPGKKPRPLVVALTHALAMAFHQLAVFFFPVAVVGLYLQTAESERRQRFALVLQYAAASFLLTFGAYCLAFYLQTGGFDLRAFSRWLTNYSPENGFNFNLKDCLKYTLNGQFKLFFGGRFNFLKEVVNPLTVSLIGVLALSAGALVVQIFRYRRAAASGDRSASFAEFRSLAILCGVWAAVYLAFLFFWIPQNTFYRMFYLPALVVLIGILLSRCRPADAAGGRALLFVLILGVCNFLFYIYPYAQVRRETPLALAVAMNDVWSPKTVVYFSQMDSDNRLVQYFNPATTWVKLEDDVKLEDFEARLRQVYAEGGEVWMETTALKKFLPRENAAPWLKAHGTDPAQYRLKDPAYDMTVIKITP